MTLPGTDKVFAGNIPAIYESHLVPLIFEPYAADLVKRVALKSPAQVLEIAAGTGVLTRHLAALLPETAFIMATDLNQPMLDHASSIGTKRPVKWRQADAMQLPFADGTFDAVVCQFGAMFFPVKAKAFAEARRVLRPGGVFLFSVWDRIEENEFADVVATTVAAMFPDDPPRFLARTPHGYYERDQLERDVEAAGFTALAEINTIAARSRAESPYTVAFAYCQGTPLRNEIEARDASRLAEATDLSTEAIISRFGPGPVDGKIQAITVSVEAK